MLLIVPIMLVSFTALTQQVNAETLGQTKIKEGFEHTFPPTGWTISSILSIQQTTGEPGGECMTGQHAIKICCTENRFFSQIFTPIFNGKKGGGNILTFWHKQTIATSPDQLVIFVTNGIGDFVQVSSYTSSMNWTHETINLNDIIQPTKTMQVLFLAILHNKNNIYIDEVIVTGISGE